MQMSHVFLNMQEISQCQCKYHEISLKNLSQLVAAKGFPKFIAILYLVHHNKPWQSITSRSQMWLRQLIHEKEAVGDQRWPAGSIYGKSHAKSMAASRGSQETPCVKYRGHSLPSLRFVCFFSIIDWYLMMGGWRMVKTIQNLWQFWFYTDPWMAFLAIFMLTRAARSLAPVGYPTILMVIPLIIVLY